MDQDTLYRVIEEKDRAAVAVGNADLLKNVGKIMTKISAPVASTGKQGEALVFKLKSNEGQYNIHCIEEMFKERML